MTIPARERARLIESIYTTAADPGAWRGLLEKLVSVTGSRSARLLVMNAEATRVTSSIKVNIDDNYHQQYVDHYVNSCPWRPELRLKPPGRLYSTYLHFNCRQPDFYRTEFYNDWARPLNIHHGICGTVFRDTSKSVQLLIQRTRGQGYYTEQETAFLNDLVPHLQHSLLLAGQFAGRHARAGAIAIAAGRETLPFLLLDESLRVTHLGAGVKKVITESSGIEIKNDRLLITDELSNRRLQRLLRECLTAAATRLLCGTGGTLAISRPNKTNLHLLARPVHPDIPMLLNEPASFVAVYIFDPDSEIEIDGEQLRRLYSLSEAETRVAVAMVAESDSAQLAKNCGISLHTVRSHLKSIFCKTVSRNRAELMKRLLTGPARRR